MVIAEVAERLEKSAGAMPPGARALLIRLLELPEEALALEVGRLHEQRPLAFSEALSYELMRKGILVTVVNPGVVATETFPHRDRVDAGKRVMQAGDIAPVIVKVVKKGIAPRVVEATLPRVAADRPRPGAAPVPVRPQAGREAGAALDAGRRVGRLELTVGRAPGRSSASPGR
jgi:hypothetical protein